jgi:hypothetical protein
MKLARLITALAIIGATCAEAQPLSGDLQKATDCMLRVLKTTSGVSDPKIDTANSLVCLEYRPDEKAVWLEPTTFCLDPNFHSTKTRYVFTGHFPGVLSPTEKETDIHVSKSVMEKWDAQCGVFANGIST